MKEIIEYLQYLINKGISSHVNDYFLFYPSTIVVKKNMVAILWQSKAKYIELTLTDFTDEEDIRKLAVYIEKIKINFESHTCN